MAQKNLNKVYPFIDGGKTGKYGFSKLSFIKSDTEFTAALDAVEGQLRYDTTEQKFKFWDGSAEVALAAATTAGIGLDEGYNLSNTIAVDGSAVTLTATSTTNDTFQINSAVATGAAKALVDLVWTGTPNATANMLRLDASGATVSGTPYMMEFVAGGKDIGAIYIDTDAATDNQVEIHNDGIIGAGKSMLYLNNDGDINATGTLLMLDASGSTGSNTAYAQYINCASIDMGAIYIDSDAATDDTVVIHNDGNQGAGKALLLIDIDGTPNATGYGLHIDGTGITATNTPYVAKIDTNGVDVGALNIDSDAATDDAVIINGGGNLGDGKAVLALTADGASQTAGGCLLTLTNSGTPDTDSRYLEIVGNGVDARAMYIDTDSATQSGVYVLNQGNIGAGKAAVHIDIDGTPNATGNALLVDGSGATATNTPYLVKFATNTKDIGALYIDTDAATDSGVVITGGGAVANNTAVLEVKWDGTPANAGSNLVRIDGSGGTNTVKPVLLEVYDDSVAVGLSVSTASIEDMVTFIGTGATGSAKSVVDITSTGTLNAAGNLLRLDLTGATCTSVPTALEIVGTGMTARGIYVDTDGTTVGAAKFHSGGALTDGVAVVNITNDGNLATGGNLLNVTLGGTPHAAAAAVEIVSAQDCKALDITTSAATNSAVKITGVGAVANDMALLHVSHGTGAIVAGGSIVRIEGNANAAGATAYGMTINANGTNLEALWVEAGTVLIAETLTVTGVTTCTGGVVTSIGTAADLHDTAPVIGDLTTAFGAAYATKAGWIGTVRDTSTSKVYLVSSNGTTFTYTLMTTSLA